MEGVPSAYPAVMAQNGGARGAAKDVEDKAEQVADHPWMEKAARAGFIMSGVVHLLIGWIALQVGFGTGGGSADQSGALSTLAEAPGGMILLWIGGITMIALALWFAAEAWFGGKQERETKDVVTHVGKSAGKAVVYAALAFTALRFATGGSSDSGEQTSEITGMFLQNAAGRILVGIAGLVVIGIGVYHVVKGITRKFEEDLKTTGGGNVGKAVVVTGVAGYVSKGLALAGVGVLFGWAAIGADAEKATGMDGAIKQMATLPAGTVLLAVVGAGLILYGIYSILRSRYASM